MVDIFFAQIEPKRAKTKYTLIWNNGVNERKLKRKSELKIFKSK